MEVSFDASLYSRAAVANAVEAFAELGEFHVEQGDAHIIVRGTLQEGLDERLLTLELANYALGLTAESQPSG